MLSPLFVSLLGSSAMIVLVIGLWFPAYLRQRALRRRLGGFVNAGGPRGFALDLGGRKRNRAPRRATSEDRGILLMRTIARMIARAQVDVTVGEVIAAIAVLGALGFVVATVWSGVLIYGLLAMPFAAMLPIIWLLWQHRRLKARFERQLIDTVAVLSSSVRAGHSLLQALEHVASEAPEPTKHIFGVVVREVGLGAAQEDALERLADRFRCDDLELIVSAVNVHSHVGGSLAKVLDAIADTIRERTRVAGDIKGLTAQQRYSAYVLSILPVIAAIGLFAFSPDYASVLLQPGPLRMAVVVAGVCVVLGFLTMRKLASVDV
jgi:tight adherence protein B